MAKPIRPKAFLIAETRVDKVAISEVDGIEVTKFEHSKV